jgi:hypothetical protein
MSETINLDRDHREVVRGIVKDSSVLCSATSAPDVYVHVITAKDTAELHKGDGTVVPKMTRTRFHVFRVNSGNDPLGDRRRHRPSGQRDGKIKYAVNGFQPDQAQAEGLEDQVGQEGQEGCQESREEENQVEVSPAFSACTQ